MERSSGCVCGDSGMRRVGGRQGAGGRGVEEWGVELADDRVAADAVNCVSGAEAAAATWSFGKESDTKETTIASYDGGADK